jgi:thymidylate kinase
MTTPPAPLLPSHPFICLLGIDGSGKTTVLEALAATDPDLQIFHWKQFRPAAQPPTVPAETKGEELARALGSYSRASLLLYMVALEYDFGIRPALQAGQRVVVDSYWYKLAAKERLLGHSAALLYPALTALPAPQHIIFIDTPPEVAVARKPTAPRYEGHQSTEAYLRFQTRLRSEILEFIAGVPQVIIDGCQAIPAVQQQVLAACRALWHAQNP